MAIYHFPSTSRPTNHIQSRLAKIRIINVVHATTLQMSSDKFCWMYIFSSKIDYPSGFVCPKCGDQPRSVVCDATSLAFRRQLLPTEEVSTCTDDCTLLQGWYAYIIQNYAFRYMCSSWYIVAHFIFIFMQLYSWPSIHWWPQMSSVVEKLCFHCYWWQYTCTLSYFRFGLSINVLRRTLSCSCKSYNPYGKAYSLPIHLFQLTLWFVNYVSCLCSSDSNSTCNQAYEWPL